MYNYSISGAGFGACHPPREISYERRRQTKRSINVKILGAMLCVIVFLSLTRVSASAAKVDAQVRELTYFEPITNTYVDSYPRVGLDMGGTYINESAYLINGTTYVPLRITATAFGADVSYDAKTRTASVGMRGLEMTASDGSYVLYANGRPILTKTPIIILSDGRMYVPVRSIAKAFSLDVVWHADRRVSLLGNPTPLAHASVYYREDEVYWLSRIISAESAGESLLGQIAVGNVVLNRLRHPDYPSTVWGVIFDKRYGVQFSPVANGTVYRTPTYSATLAAKICLEGVSISPDILFFMQPEKSTSSWIPQNRRYACTIGNHYFFY